jgi:hypothetical protein
MSTFGGSADRTAEQLRQRERRLAVHEIKVKDAVRFAVVTLRDEALPDDLARALAVDALLLREWP